MKQLTGNKDAEYPGNKVEEIFSAYLEKEGLRKTPERFAVLREIYLITQHFDIDSLYVHMKTKKFNVSRATIYNTIEHLLNCELVIKRQFGKNIAQFERSYAYKQHDHLICQDCEKVMEFCDPRIQQIQTMMGEILGFHVTNHSLNLYGRCKQLESSGKCENMQRKKQVNLAGN